MSKKRRSEYEHYQPNNPLTLHYITTGAILPNKVNIKKRAPKRPSSTNKQKVILSTMDQSIE